MSYSQGPAEVSYDFSEKNIERVARLNAKNGRDDNDYGLKPLYEYMAGKLNKSPDTLDGGEKGTITEELIRTAQSEKTKIQKHDRRMWISGLSTCLGYVLAATTFVLPHLPNKDGLQLLGMAMGTGVLSFASLSTSKLLYSMGNLCFKFTAENYKQSENAQRHLRKQDRLNFIVNGNDASRCVDKRETAEWAEQYRHRQPKSLQQ